MSNGTESGTRFRDIPQFTEAGYEVDVPWNDVGRWISIHSEAGSVGIDLDPLYQRGHVWTTKQQTAYVEFCLRGGTSGRHLYWNCSTWGRRYSTPLELVDGKQRLTAVTRFLADEVLAFGRRLSEYNEKLLTFHPGTMFRFHIADLMTQREVISWYLELNYAGTPHTAEELARVRALLLENTVCSETT